MPLCMMRPTDLCKMPVSPAIWRVVLCVPGAPSWLSANSLTVSMISAVRDVRGVLPLPAVDLLCCFLAVFKKTRSWCWPTRATHLEVSQGHQTIVPFHMLCIVSSSAIVTLSLQFYNIQLQKMAWPWNPCQKSSRSLKVVPFDRLCMVPISVL